MARPTTSPLGPRQFIGVKLTPGQRDIINRARAAGFSKQKIVSDGVGLVAGVNDPEPYGSQRKTVLFKIGPEAKAALKNTCERLAATYGQVVTACAEALLDLKKDRQ